MRRREGKKENKKKSTNGKEKGRKKQKEGREKQARVKYLYHEGSEKRLEETAQQVRLLCCTNLKILVLNPRHHIKGHGHSCNPSTNKGGLLGLVSQQPSSRFSERLCLNEIRQRVIEQDTQCLSLGSASVYTRVYTHIHLRMHMHANAWLQRMQNLSVENVA